MEFLFLIILSIAMILSVPKFNEKLPIGLQNIIEKKIYLIGIFICVLILSMFNIQYLVYFSILYIMIKVCFVKNGAEKIEINVDEKIKEIKDNIENSNNLDDSNNLDQKITEKFSLNTRIYHDNFVCKKLNGSHEVVEEIVNSYNNDYFSPK